ncbi:type II toxin-antitoxin system ParD family antitoxin [Caulobacter radicis]|uniref:ribbon-helix-helix domain-containing protein n=1 Tax=Caulobacter radicis TaxID=2172650 RepID=UPI000D5742E3|nr:type II toxin-antitoxin system ParD family antitoxin [Caulobacter radicis]PVM91093.1 type II toxin-antitoxin system ParD family antitoxin [Caulobacter radicis]
MATMNVSLSKADKDWVEERARTDRYDTPADYVRDLIERDRIRHAKIQAMQGLVDEALASGDSEHGMSEILEVARARASALGL